MAIISTGAIYKSLVFDGESSRDYGIYITGQAVYNAPERDVEMINIPGRNGSFALDKGRFQNIEVSYPAGIFADNETDFAQGISDFRNFLCSRNGYVRLTDDYNPDEYRMAVYKSGLDVSPAQLRAGEFQIVFDCKPQRFLTSGEEPIAIGEWHETETASGEIASFEAVDGDGVKSLVVDIEPYQSGSGTPSPDNVRPISGYDSVVVTVADDHDSPTVSNTYTIDLNGTRYGGTLDVVSGVLTDKMGMVDLGTLSWSYNSSNGFFYANVVGGVTNLGVYVMPNILCSIYKTDVSKFGADFPSAENGIVTWSRDSSQVQIKNTAYTDATSFKTAMDGVQLCYELATPTTVQLTAQEVELLVGLNQVWANSGDVSVEYGTAPNVVINPTLFESSPMLEVEGYGTIAFNGYEITINDVVIGEIQTSTRSSQSIDKMTQQSVSKTYQKVINYSSQAGALESGDKLFISSLKITQKARYLGSGLAPTPTVSGNISGVTASGSVRNYSQVESGTTYNYASYTTTISIGTTELTAFTNGSYSSTITSVLKASNNTTNGTVTIGINITNTASGILTIQVVCSGTSSGLGDIYDSGGSIEYGRTYLYSTRSILGSPLYVDCDLGEAYKYEGDTIVSINQHVDLGSDLPKLASGANEIAYDNTVTDLKVVPRWWKI